jgi:osmoprotectant transport system ATP-binding protein
VAAILEIRDVSCALGGRPILRHIDLTVEEGETVVLLGRSGSGKTTLLKTVNGLVPASSGEIRFEGRTATEWKLVEMRRRMGYVIQDAGLFPHWTVEKNIGLVPRLEKWEPSRVAARVETLLETVGLPPAEFRHRYPRELSGGQRQRGGDRAGSGGRPAAAALR